MLCARFGYAGSSTSSLSRKAWGSCCVGTNRCAPGSGKTTERIIAEIAPARPFSLSAVEIRAAPGEEGETEALGLAEQEASRPFDLALGPVVRAKLLRFDPQDHILVLTMHHIASDAWSVGILFRELSALYDAFSAGKPSPLPELPIQYGDFAQWQRDWLAGEVLEEQLSYWRKQLVGDPAPLQLPTDRPRPTLRSSRGAVTSVHFSRELTEALQELSRRESVTLFMTLLAAFESLLSRYTGQEDVVVGIPIANRGRAEIEKLIGFFANTLALRSDLSGDPTFRELLGRVREVALGAYAHQDLPFEKLVEELRPERNLGRNPLFQVMMSFQSAAPDPLALRGLTLDLVPLETRTSKFDLALGVEEKDGSLSCHCDYSTDLFEDTTIQRMLGHFRNLLEGIVADPLRRLSAFDFLGDAERHQVLVEWNQTETEYPRDKTVHRLFEEQAERAPQAVAVEFEGKRLTYGQLNERANRLARYLSKRGVGPEVLVGLCVERSLEMVVGLLGILKAGGAYLPLDPAYPGERLRFMLEDAGAQLVLTQKRLASSVPEGAQRVHLDADWAEIARESGREPPEPGLRGKPRLRHLHLRLDRQTQGGRDRARVTDESHLGLRRTGSASGKGERVLQFASLSFDASAQEIFCDAFGRRDSRPALGGDDRYGRDLSRSVSGMEAHGPRPSDRLLARAGRGRSRRGATQAFPSRCVSWSSGERGRCRNGSRTGRRERGGPHAALERLWANGSDGGRDDAWEPGAGQVGALPRTVPIGRPMANTQTYVLDARHCSRCRSESWASSISVAWAWRVDIGIVRI